MRTLYTVHHETSRAASRKLTLWFWSGVLLSFFSYSLIAWIFLALLFWLFDNSIAHTAPYALIVGLATSLVVIYGYYTARSNARDTPAAERAAALGAEPLGTPQYPAERQYRNIVEEMAVAAGIRPPDILLLRHDDSINAFVIGGARGSIAIAVTAGALRYLERDELQALVAHEFGHIVDDDLALYGRLTAMIHGYRSFADLRYRLLGDEDAALSIREKMLIDTAKPQNEAEAQAIRQLAYASASHRRDREADAEQTRLISIFGGTGILFGLLLFILTLYSLLLTGYARLMQAAIAREREWMADAKAVQFTRNGDALARVFQKVLALGHRGKHPAPPREENRHLLLIDYQHFQRGNRLNTHPDTIARLKRYGDYHPDAIAKLGYALQQRPPHDQTDTNPKRSATHYADARFPLAMLHHHAALALPQYAPEAIIQVAMMRLANATPKGLALARHLAPDTLRPLMPVWREMLPAHHASFLPVYLNHLRRIDNPHTLKTPLKAIAAADGLTSLAEWCALEALELTNTPDATLDHHQAQPAIITLLRMTAHLLADNETQRAQYFAQLPAHTLPVPTTPWQPLATRKTTPVPCKAPDEEGWPIEPLILPDDAELARARNALHTLRELRPVYRQTLVDGLARQYDAQKTVSADAYAWLRFLQYALSPAA
ncbi:MAG: M48 family metalloprotease [Cardiobacteriaceae bacterium]|nr:M48 family metalloprotease [Cardiobacteriaceae bacterium]